MSLLKTLSKPRAGITFNLKGGYDSNDQDEEYDSSETIEFLEKKLEKLGFSVLRFEQTPSFVSDLQDQRLDYVFNIAEGRGTTRVRESQVPAILDWLDIPHYGSDALSLGITLDKWLTHVHLKGFHIPVPHMECLSVGANLDAIEHIFDGTSYIIKPRWEGSSKGIFNNSVTSSFKDAQELIKKIHTNYRQPAVMEQFLAGQEVTVGVIGNETPEVIGMMCISEKAPSANAKPFVYSIEHKRSWRDTIQYQKGEDVIASKTVSLIKKNAIAAFQALELKDAARIDFRLDTHGKPYIIDINPLPGLSPEYSDMMIISGLYHLKFDDVVDKIMKNSLKRNNLWK